MLHEIKQEQFEDGNIVFKDGDQCRGIMYIIDGEIELSYSKKNQSILVDTLGRGSYLFPYTSLTNEQVRQSNLISQLALNGIAKGKTNVIVIPQQTILEMREHQSLNEKLD